MADVDFKLDAGWWRKLTAGEDAQAAVDAKADEIHGRAQARAGMDHSGEPVEVYVKHGSRDEKAAQAWVGLADGRHRPGFAQRIEASRGIISGSIS